MPKRPPRYCSAPGCSELVDKGRCEKHRRAARVRERTERRTSEQYQYYGSARWKKLRARKRKEEPLCRRCKVEGRVTPMEEVHHRDGDWSNEAWDNLESICRDHHNAVTHGARA